MNKLSNRKLKKYKTVAASAAKKAGHYLLKNFLKIHGPIRFEFKSNHEIVTEFDKGAEKIILSEIKKNFPDHDVLSEEDGLDDNASREFLWIVDPLDGTTNFTLKNPIFSVSIALAYKGEVILGVVYAPFLKEMFSAQKGEGAYLNNKKISTSKQNILEKSFLTFCHGSKEEMSIKRAIAAYNYFKLKVVDMRQLGSAAAELCWVGVGRTESIMIPGANPWDVTAGMLVVREAGGRVTDWQGKEWNLKSQDILASNGKIHGAVLRVLGKI